MTTPVMQAYDRLVAAFPSTGTSHTVAVRAPAERAGEVRAALTAWWHQRAQADPLFAPGGAMEPQIEVVGGRPGLHAGHRHAVRQPQRRGSAGRWTGCAATWCPRRSGGVTGAEYAVGGEVAGSVDYAAHVRSKLPLVMGFVLVADVPRHGLDVPLHGGRADLDRAEPALRRRRVRAGGAGLPGHAGRRVCWASHRWGRSSSWLPLFLFVVLFGLSMDYHVFVVSRIREAVRRGMPQPGRGGARHHDLGRRRDECGNRDGGGVLDLRHAQHH